MFERLEGLQVQSLRYCIVANGSALALVLTSVAGQAPELAEVAGKGPLWGYLLGLAAATLAFGFHFLDAIASKEREIMHKLERILADFPIDSLDSSEKKRV